MTACCRAAAVLRNETAVDAVEMFDHASLIQSREISEDLVKLVRGLGEVRVLTGGWKIFPDLSLIC